MCSICFFFLFFVRGVLKTSSPLWIWIFSLWKIIFHVSTSTQLWMGNMDRGRGAYLTEGQRKRSWDRTSWWCCILSGRGFAISFRTLEMETVEFLCGLKRVVINCCSLMALLFFYSQLTVAVGLGCFRRFAQLMVSSVNFTQPCIIGLRLLWTVWGSVLLFFVRSMKFLITFFLIVMK